MGNPLPYDFCLPIDLTKLENERLRLVPMEVSLFIFRVGNRDLGWSCSSLSRARMPEIMGKPE